MQWEKITDVILVTAFAVLAVYALIGLVQLIRRKSLKKVDKELEAFIPPLALMAAVYIIFDKIWILSTRPDGSGEPSFPSSHTMIVATIFLLAALANRKYIKQKPLRLVLDSVMLLLIVLTAAGRILSDKHWPADVAAALVFAAVFAGIYYLIIKKWAKPPKGVQNA